MKMTLILCAALIAGACSAHEPSPSDKLMDEIEQQVRLPKEAWPLQDYARHYAFDRDGKVTGVYVLRESDTSGEKAPDYGCEDLTLDKKGKMVGKPVPCPPTPESKNRVAAGERRWFSDFAELPLETMDGGCGIVTLRFDPSTKRVEQAFCNGRA